MSDRLVIPSNFRQRILKQLHRGSGIGNREDESYRSQLCFLAKNRQRHRKFCQEMQQLCHSKTPTKVPLQSWPQATKPWERIHIDFAWPFFDQYFLVVVDAHSKWPEVKIVQSSTTPAVTEFLDELFSRFGDPETVVSDNGSQFTSDHFAAFCKEHVIQHLRTAPYHP
ncbi:uncharacterized protein K02A2.6-like [Wyeomyia smithii]|uniref:uncharacterized protein K02A2.6-like n=1 Tax=Wyeomyia smithii TaxID=174621 RepID=UPI002467C13E|nr:uncharacterized protein K02A2.6-like [Wyeomyia smithii]